MTNQGQFGDNIKRPAFCIFLCFFITSSFTNHLSRFILFFLPWRASVENDLSLVRKHVKYRFVLKVAGQSQESPRVESKMVESNKSHGTLPSHDSSHHQEYYTTKIPTKHILITMGNLSQIEMHITKSSWSPTPPVLWDDLRKQGTSLGIFIHISRWHSFKLYMYIYILRYWGMNLRSLLTKASNLKQQKNVPKCITSWELIYTLLGGSSQLVSG